MHTNIAYPLKKFSLFSGRIYFRREMERSHEMPFVHVLSVLEEDMGVGREVLV